MLKPGQMYNALKRQTILNMLKKSTRLSLRKKIQLFEERYQQVVHIPIKKAREYIRWRIADEASDLLEERHPNKLVISEQNTPELFEIWNLK